MLKTRCTRRVFVAVYLTRYTSRAINETTGTVAFTAGKGVIGLLAKFFAY